MPAASRTSGNCRCPRCRGEFQAAAFSPPRPSEGAPTWVAESGAACAVHELNAATAACERCGAFACQLCRVSADGLTLCAACFDRLAQEGALPSMVRKTVDHASAAWSCAVVGLLAWIVAIPFNIAGMAMAIWGLVASRRTGETDRVGSLWTALVVNACLAGLSVWFWVAILLEND